MAARRPRPPRRRHLCSRAAGARAPGARPSAHTMVVDCRQPARHQVRARASGRGAHSSVGQSASIIAWHSAVVTSTVPPTYVMAGPPWKGAHASVRRMAAAPRASPIAAGVAPRLRRRRRQPGRPTRRHYRSRRGKRRGPACGASVRRVPRASRVRPPPPPRRWRTRRRGRGLAAAGRAPGFVQVDEDVEGERVGRGEGGCRARRRCGGRRVRQQRRLVPIIPCPRRHRGVDRQLGRVGVGVGGLDRVHAANTASDAERAAPRSVPGTKRAATAPAQSAS